MKKSDVGRNTKRIPMIMYEKPCMIRLWDVNSKKESAAKNIAGGYIYGAVISIMGDNAVPTNRHVSRVFGKILPHVMAVMRAVQNKSTKFVTLTLKAASSKSTLKGKYESMLNMFVAKNGREAAVLIEKFPAIKLFKSSSIAAASCTGENGTATEAIAKHTKLKIANRQNRRFSEKSAVNRDSSRRPHTIADMKAAASKISTQFTVKR